MNRIAIAVSSPILVLFSSIALRAQTPQPLQVVQATYGAEGAQMDVTKQTQSLTQSGQANVRVGNHLFGKDPAFGKVKTLSVVFVKGGVQYQTAVREGEQLSFAQSNVNQSNVASQTFSTLAAPPATPAVQQHRLAPEGVFYLMERVVVKSDSSVTGFAPGTRVKLIEDRGEKLFVASEDNIKFEASSDKVTNDLDLAALVAKQDAQSQQAVAQSMKEQMDAYRAAKEKEIPLYDQQQRDVEARRTAAAIAAKGPNPLDREAYHESRPWWWYGHPYIYRRR